jgi:hypothetical protein
MAVSLMTYIPDELIFGGIEDIMESNSKFYHS